MNRTKGARERPADGLRDATDPAPQAEAPAPAPREAGPGEYDEHQLTPAEAVCYRLRNTEQNYEKKSRGRRAVHYPAPRPSCAVVRPASARSTILRRDSAATSSS